MPVQRVLDGSHPGGYSDAAADSGSGADSCVIAAAAVADHGTVDAAGRTEPLAYLAVVAFPVIAA